MGELMRPGPPRRSKPCSPPTRICTLCRESLAFSSMTQAAFRLALSPPTSDSIGPEADRLSRSGSEERPARQYFWDSVRGTISRILPRASPGHFCDSVRKWQNRRAGCAVLSRIVAPARLPGLPDCAPVHAERAALSRSLARLVCCASTKDTASGLARLSGGLTQICLTRLRAPPKCSVLARSGSRRGAP